MKTIFKQILLFLVISTSTVLTLPTDERIRKHGYPVEKHVLQTRDGYVLTLFRIPHPQDAADQNTTRPIAFLQHGLLSSSDCWILNGPGLAIAYMLVEDGYDVWLGNTRGNTYSKRHVNYSPFFQRFWLYDWHEIAMYDVPAMIDYVLYTTGQKSLHYVGHSQGTTVLFVMTSMIPSFNKKIKSAQLLAPVAWMNNIRGPFVDLITPFLGLPNGFVELFGSMEFLPNNMILRALGDQMCKEDSIIQEFCSNVIFLICGWDKNSFNKSLMADIIDTHPAGASVNQVMHFLQEHLSGKFRQFDYGFLRNIVVYGRFTPPEYNLSKVKVPIFLYYGDNDYLSHPVDVHRLMSYLPNLKKAFRVPDKDWNHLDYLWANNVKEMIFDKILENVNAMESLVIKG
ncbi:lipase 3-like [Eupeodes corollae]|uniref:lipase 3-like n=1 Tax=Eupeodes corollae TaxID=290404 RepID=UPI00248FDA96|nr:lipase 3-like [Eupeodes corollae]XP_055902275.1 lipase 3-like [Eupeodes corollae]